MTHQRHKIVFLGRIRCLRFSVASQVLELMEIFGVYLSNGRDTLQCRMPKHMGARLLLKKHKRIECVRRGVEPIKRWSSNVVAGRHRIRQHPVIKWIKATNDVTDWSILRKVVPC